MIVEERRLTVPGLQSRVAIARDFVADAARRAGLDERAVHHCTLAVDEAFTNIIEHGYEADDPELAVDVACRIDGNRFWITITDEGPYFDPLQQVDPDPNAPLDKRAPGGWGIFFFKKVMDEVFYRYEDSRNVLIMVKYLGAYPRPDGENRGIAQISVTMASPTLHIIAPHGRLEADVCPTLERLVTEQWDMGSTALILDLGDVDYISSAGLKTLVGLWQRARQNKREMVFAALSPRVHEVFAIIGLDSVFTVYESTIDAVTALSKK